MSKSASFRLQLSSIMDIMTKTAIEQICTIVESDFTVVRQELSRLICENAVLKDQVHSLGNERRQSNRVSMKTSKTQRSVSVQTEEGDGEQPSIKEIFGKEWCSSLWGRRHAGRRDEMAIDVDLYSVQANKAKEREPASLVPVKVETIDVDTYPSCAGKPARNSQVPETSGFDRSEKLIDDEVSGKVSDISEIKITSSNMAQTRFIETNIDDAVNQLIAPIEDALEVDGHCLLGEFSAQNVDAEKMCAQALQNRMNGIQKQNFPKHGKKGKYSCEVCGKCFHSNTNLVIHYAVHTGEKPYKCSFCGKGFSQKGNVQAHERIHRGERPFSCAICGRSFRQKICLRNHEHIHRGEKPFVCGICGKGFNQKTTLQQHIPIHERAAQRLKRTERNNRHLNNSYMKDPNLYVYG